MERLTPERRSVMSKPKKSLTASQIITKRRNNLAVSRDYRSLIMRVILIGVGAWVLFTKVFLITQVSGNEMFPALKDGDLVIAFRLQEDYAKNDVVVCRVNGKQYIGRIVAREGDVVSLDDSGTMRVNGTVQSGEIIYPTYAKEGMEYPYQVPLKHIFLMGDHRTQAQDSRDFGAVSMQDVEGKVITILRRRGL